MHANMYIMLPTLRCCNQGEGKRMEKGAAEDAADQGRQLPKAGPVSVS